MKISRNYTISELNVRELSKVKNASALIDGLLTEHFKRMDLRSLPLPELKKKLEVLEKKEKLNKELKDLDNGK